MSRPSRAPDGPPSETRRAARDIGSWPAPAAPTSLQLPPLPSKLFFRIGEVAELVGVRPHVLRYWETELGLLRPMKTRGSHRQYRRRDVEIARLVRQLTEIEGYTVAGAKKKIAELRGGRRERASLSRDLGAIRDDLLATSSLLDVPVGRRHTFEISGLP
ncbi:MAG: MerR family transcriptional regulator [Sandaracinaceae bacterium]|jgi:DNA-binding transcriptional MerR regulator|nr:MerR family transcriptional regulator [Sandaracinaceae bacterium]